METFTDDDTLSGSSFLYYIYVFQYEAVTDDLVHGHEVHVSAQIVGRWMAEHKNDP